MNENILKAIPTLENDIPPGDFAVQTFWIPVAWGLGIALLLAGIALWLVRRRRKKQTPPPTPLQVAFAELERLAEELPPLRECSLRLSMVLRSYLTGQVQDPALFETHEEFSRRMDALTSVPTACRYDTRFLLERLADMKYAGNVPQDPQKARVLIEETRGIISHIDRERVREAAEAAVVNKVRNIS